MRGPPPRHPDEQREQLPPVEGFISDAADLAPGVRVVYPNQGVCKVVGTEEQDISGHKLQVVRMEREEDGAAVLVPRNKVPSIGLRRVATGGQIEGVFHYLAAQLLDPELDWKIRHRDNADRLVGGGILGLAEVVKGLHGLSRLRPLPTKEREQYDNARHLLVAEVAVALGVPPGLAEDHIDYALMPPTGVKFDVPPPPQPVQLPQRIRRRKPVAEEEGGLADLGLADLGLDLESLDAEAAAPEVAGAVKEEGAEIVEGAEAPAAAEDGEGSEVPGQADETDETDDEDVALPAARPATGRPAQAERSAAPAKGRPAKKAAPARPKKPAAKKSEKAEKPAQKTPKKPAKAASKAKGKKK